MHDKAFLHLIIECMKSAVGQVREQLPRDPDLPLETVKKAIDLRACRERIAGDDQASARFFAASIASSFVELTYHELRQR